MTDYAELRAALSRVEDGPWWLAGDLPNEVRPLNPVVRGRIDGSARLTICRTGTNNHTQRDWDNAEYIAACHPEAIRSLLAERDDYFFALQEISHPEGTRASATQIARAALAQEQGEKHDNQD